MSITKLVFFVFLVLFVVSLIMNFVRDAVGLSSGRRAIGI